MKESYDAKHRAESFEVGEFVLLSPRGLFLSVAGSKKFMAKQLGPFGIIKRVGRLAYKLLLPASMGRVLPVFHVSLLKRPRDGGRRTAPPTAMLLDGAEECEMIECSITEPNLINASPTTGNIMFPGGVWDLRRMNGCLNTS